MMNKAFEKKLNHSIELLRKAERIALKYDRDDGFYLAFSGGKDSQALYHVAKMAGVKFKAHMSLTSVDPPQVIRFVKNVYPDVVLHKPKMSIYQRAVERGILPTVRVRWCCADFKESAGAGKVTLIGIRKEESARRAKRHEVEVSDRKFGGNLEEFEAWSKTQIEKQQNKSKRKINEDEFSVKADNEVRCINGKDSILISPIFDWSEKDVWYFLNEVAKVPHCSLYDEGWHRIGCIGCPMSSAKQKQIENTRYPHVKRNWIKAIKAIRGGKIPSRLHLVEHQSRLDASQKRQRIAQDTGGWIAHPDPKHWLSNSSMGGDWAAPTKLLPKGHLDGRRNRTDTVQEEHHSASTSTPTRTNYGVWNEAGFQVAPLLTA